MKRRIRKKIRYVDEPMNNVEVVTDFLPPPGALACKEETTKITMALSKNSTSFFKKQAASHRTPYQK